MTVIRASIALIVLFNLCLVDSKNNYHDAVKHLLLGKFWKEEVTENKDGSLVLTTKYKIPYIHLPKKPAGLVQGGLVPVDCSDIRRVWPKARSGVYKIYPAGGMGYSAYCDMKLDGGGWTVFQRRVDGSESFERSWSDYRNGFGDLQKEHWLGLQALHEITVHGLYELRINLGDFAGQTRFAKYSQFAIGRESSGYQISFAGYTGTAGESMERANGMKFSTYDRDNDIIGDNCAKSANGAWWFKDCFRAHLNGKYFKNPTKNPKWRGLIWNTWHGPNYSLKNDVMMLRRHHKEK